MIISANLIAGIHKTALSNSTPPLSALGLIVRQLWRQPVRVMPPARLFTPPIGSLSTHFTEA